MVPCRKVAGVNDHQSTSKSSRLHQRDPALERNTPATLARQTSWVVFSASSLPDLFTLCRKLSETGRMRTRTFSEVSGSN